VIVLYLILLAMLVQIAAAGLALRINRVAGRPLAWLLLSAALVLMAARRFFLLVEYSRNGLPSYLLPNEVLSLLISILLLGAMIFIRGIFQSKALQAAGLEEARTQADKLAAVMAATPVPLWIAEDPQCRVIHGNHTAALLHRLPDQANHSKSAPEAERPSHFQLLRDGRELLPEEMPMQRAVQTGLEVRDVPLDLVFTDGEVRHLVFSAMPMRDSEGRVQGAVCCAADLTGIRRAQEALAKAQKMESLGMLSGGIAHDFNNIFQAMVANLEMAQASVLEESRAQAYLERLKTGLDPIRFI
jgi:PAS domain-containing protein